MTDLAAPHASEPNESPQANIMRQHWLKAVIGAVVAALSAGGTYAGNMVLEHETKLAGIEASAEAHKEALNAQVMATKEMKKEILKALDDNKAAVAGAVAETRMRAKEDSEELKEQVQRMDSKIEKLQWRVIRGMKER